MSDTIIKVQNISKCYRIGLKQEKYQTLSGKITQFIKSPYENFKNLRKLQVFQENEQSADIFWALKDINFEVKQGEVLGIIGRNGAGKSTLLKILAQITEPTTGRIDIYGRIASLLEVGTGFNPELTGRENVYLNGTILGMTKKEITRKFDEIVDFSGVEKFIDTPVKRYSSGMKVRLAFAVAAHLDPEILLIDEVLAVGDAEFQKKCLGKMQDVSGKEGRTVLFVSHNMSAVLKLCSKSILLKDGNFIGYDISSGIIKQYLNELSFSKIFINNYDKIKTRIQKAELFEEFETIIVDLFIISDKNRKASIDFRIKDVIQTPICFGSIGTFNENELVQLVIGENRFLCKFSTKDFAVGVYFLSIDLTIPDVEYLDRLEDCFQIEVIRPPIAENRRVLDQKWGIGTIQIELNLTK